MTSKPLPNEQWTAHTEGDAVLIKLVACGLAFAFLIGKKELEQMPPPLAWGPEAHWLHHMRKSVWQRMGQLP